MMLSSSGATSHEELNIALPFVVVHKAGWQSHHGTWQEKQVHRSKFEVYTSTNGYIQRCVAIHSFICTRRFYSMTGAQSQQPSQSSNDFVKNSEERAQSCCLCDEFLSSKLRCRIDSDRSSRPDASSVSSHVGGGVPGGRVYGYGNTWYQNGTGIVFGKWCLEVVSPICSRKHQSKCFCWCCALLIYWVMVLPLYTFVMYREICTIPTTRAVTSEQCRYPSALQTGSFSTGPSATGCCISATWQQSSGKIAA